MDTSIWGPPFWFSLHTISMNYPEKPSYIDKQQHLIFFESLKKVLPCQTCRDHYAIFLQNKPISPYLDNKNTLKKWVLDCHNNVNKINGEKVWTIEQLDNHYNNIYDNKHKFKCDFVIKKKITNNNISNILIVVLFTIIFCFYIFKF